MNEFMLTTIDNPFNPFDDFMNWLRFDIEKGYNTCEIVDRLSFTSDQLTDSENCIEINRAIDEFIASDPLDIYRKIKAGEEVKPKNILMEG